MNPRENLRIALVVGGLAAAAVGATSAIANYDNHITTHEKVSSMGYNRVLMSPEVVEAVNNSDLWFYGSAAVALIGAIAASSAFIIPEPTTSFTLPSNNR